VNSERIEAEQAKERVKKGKLQIDTIDTSTVTMPPKCFYYGAF
jgi:hypothetical protein